MQYQEARLSIRRYLTQYGEEEDIAEIEKGLVLLQEGGNQWDALQLFSAIKSVSKHFLFPAVARVLKKSYFSHLQSLYRSIHIDTIQAHTGTSVLEIRQHLSEYGWDIDAAGYITPGLNAPDVTPSLSAEEEEKLKRFQESYLGRVVK